MMGFLRNLLFKPDRPPALDLIEQLDQFVQELLTRGRVDDHRREMVTRAQIYTLRRMSEGAITDLWHAKLVFAAFADGFCTGVHKGTLMEHS